MSSVDRGEAPSGRERKPSIETEPLTLYEIQLQEAREAAIDILNSKGPEEVLSIFSQKETVSPHGWRCTTVFAAGNEMQEGFRDEQAHGRSLIIEGRNDHRQHSEHKNKQEEQLENFVINNSELDVGEKDHPPFTERRDFVKAASAPV